MGTPTQGPGGRRAGSRESLDIRVDPVELERIAIAFKTSTTA